MITIDGSYGYGQILRTAIALSALTLKPVKIINIRKNRPRSGLAPQHLTGVKIAGEFCDAEISGLRLGSLEVEFIPKKHHVVDKKIDIGTAGSISLLLQTLTPLLIFADRKTTLEITGGTAGLGAPTIEYLKHVTFPILSKMGLPPPEIHIYSQGFYPRGGGRIKIIFTPVQYLNQINLTEQGIVKLIRGFSVSGSLPADITKRQSASAQRHLMESGFKNIQILNQVMSTLSSGTSLTLIAETDTTIIGADELGAQGLPSEEVGRRAAEGLLSTIESRGALDKHMSDQIIPYLALARGSSSIKVEKITDHVETNIQATETMLGVKFEIDRKNNLISIRK